MKKQIILLFALWTLLLAGCGEVPQSGGADPQQPVTLSVPPEDRNQAFCWPGFVETPEGYYYSLEHLVYFCPRGGNRFLPLCAKPNCSHTDENCNAWSDMNTIGYFDGSLYSVEYFDQINVIKMNLDGSNHQVAATVDTGDLHHCTYSFVFHHGKLIVFAEADTNLPLEEQVDHLIILSLADNTQTEPVVDYYSAAKHFYFDSLYKDKIYGVGSDDRTVELDIATGSYRTLPAEIGSSFYATDSTLYYYEPDLSSLGYGFEKLEHPGFRELDLASGVVTDCGLPVDDIWEAYYDEDYIYAASFLRDGGTYFTLYFLSRDYELLDQVDLKPWQHFFGATSDRLFLSSSDPDKPSIYAQTPISFYYDKSEIGSHAMTQKPIETVVPVP